MISQSMPIMYWSWRESVCDENAAGNDFVEIDSILLADQSVLVAAT